MRADCDAKVKEVNDKCDAKVKEADDKVKEAQSAA